MNTIKFRQAFIEYSLKNGVTKAAIRYKVNRQYVYRWLKRYDETLQSLADKSHKPITKGLGCCRSEAFKKWYHSSDTLLFS